jgi:zinc and cadmium transporter
MDTLLWIIFATFIVSLLSLIGVITLSLSDKLLKKILLALVGLAAGTLIGGAFLHLIPESLHELENTVEHDTIFIYVLVGFVIFFILEKMLWRHCHEKTCKIHTFAYINLFGDGIHNFIDGLIIAAGFLASVEIGLATTIAVAVHEIPQEIGDFGVLVHGGFQKKKALLFNLITALTALVGGVIGYYLIPHMGEFQNYILPIAAGGFIYIAAADLVPELHKERRTSRTVLAFSTFILGIFLMWFAKFIFEGGLHG